MRNKISAWRQIIHNWDTKTHTHTHSYRTFLLSMKEMWKPLKCHHFTLHVIGYGLTFDLCMSHVKQRINSISHSKFPISSFSSSRFVCATFPFTFIRNKQIKKHSLQFTWSYPKFKIRLHYYKRLSQHTSHTCMC